MRPSLDQNTLQRFHFTDWLAVTMRAGILESLLRNAEDRNRPLAGNNMDASPMPAPATSSISSTFSDEVYRTEFVYVERHTGRSDPLDTEDIILDSAPPLTAEVTLSESNSLFRENLSKSARSYSIRALRSPVPSDHTDFVYFLQAKVLLANYYLWSGQILDSKSCMGTASTLALYAQLHRLGSSIGSSIIIRRVGSGLATTLAKPVDEIEKRELVDAFWSVLVTQRSFAMAVDPFDTTGDIDRGPSVNTPWPSLLDDTSLAPRTSNTVDEYLSGVCYPVAPSLSIGTMVMQAFVLYDRTAPAVAQTFNTPTFSDDIEQEFSVLDSLLSASINAAPLVDWTDFSSAIIRPSFLFYSLLDGAAIHLHGVLSHSLADSRNRSLCAAHDMFGLGIDAMKSLGMMHPVMGSVWSAGCTALVMEILQTRYRRQRGEDTDDAVRDEGLKRSLYCGLSIMEWCASSSNLMGHYLSNFRSQVLLKRPTGTAAPPSVA
ncbi:hypothetical protein C8J57DRAFT_1643745 [Mycena rebaudengoi]|nr:hypothetical protein C8J57DRAFT_1643745 [Mycena rebaudengoi]